MIAARSAKHRDHLLHRHNDERSRPIATFSAWEIHFSR
jgi:hypothetical protein